MIETDGMITVAEAAKRLNRSIEQVRRNLREGKLKGQRIGNQWFVDERSLTKPGEVKYKLRAEAFDQALRVRERIRAAYGNFDIEAGIEAGREERGG